MTASDKDTIYIDIDDEITGIIDKLSGSNGKIVALVLPKRATVLQSIVNMKLLKRAADEAKKHLVLITTEAGLLPLAGMTGIHVAKTLTSKPEIPTAPVDDDSEETVDEPSESAAPDFVPAAAATVPIGELAGLPPAASDDDVETVELDNDEEVAAAALTEKTFEPPKGLKKDKKLHVPNFERFRLLLIVGVLALILLGFGLYYGLVVAPKALIAIKTDASNVNASLNLTADSQAKILDPAKGIIPAKLAQLQKNYTQQVSTSGQKNQGAKATGAVTLTAKNCTSIALPADVPAGTGVSSNGLTYITQKTTSFSSSKIKGGCIYSQGDADTPITAQSGGANYNAADGATFGVAQRPDVTGVANGAIAGGTDNIIKVVSQGDIDSAKAKIANSDSTTKQTLQNQLVKDGKYALPVTFSGGTPTITPSANVGDPADTVTITEAVTYTMFGVDENDLKALIDNNIKPQIDTAKQSILSEGLSTASFNLESSTATTAQLTMKSVATAGPELNTTTIAKYAAGKKAGDIKRQLQSNPDVTDVTVTLSPFWVTSVPKKLSKITVTVAKPTIKTSNTNDSNP